MRTTRASNFLYLVMGALSVAIVAGVLVAVGTFDRDDGKATSSATAAPTATSTSASASAPDRRLRRSTSGSPPASSTSPPAPPRARPPARASSSTPTATIVTNDHVVEGARSVSVRFTENGDPIDAKVVGTDPSTDIALLDVDASKVEGGVKPLQLADSKDIEPGEPAIAIGSPFGLQGTVTSGIVSALGREIQAPNGFTISGIIQTDAAINPGNSGGPLLDDEGRVIGVNSQIATNGTDANSGVGFAVPIDTVKSVVPQLKADGKIDRAFLGVSTTDAAPRDGALVREVTGRPGRERRPQDRRPDHRVRRAQDHERVGSRPGGAHAQARRYREGGCPAQRRPRRRST